MNQTILTNNGFRNTNKIERMETLRYEYYKELYTWLSRNRIIVKQKIESYKQTVAEIDKEIGKEKHKAKKQQ